MQIDIEVKPRMTGAYRESGCYVKFFTDKAAEAYNEYFGTEVRKYDTVFVDKNYKELSNLVNILGLSMIYG